MEDWKISAIFSTALLGIYGFVLNHIRKKHITGHDLDKVKEGVQWKDVCDERHKAIENKFEDMKEFMKQGFGNLETLIKKKGE